MGKKSKRKNQPAATTNASTVAAPTAAAKVAPPAAPVVAPVAAPVPAPAAANEPSLPQGLLTNMHLLTPTQQTLAKALCSQTSNQPHLFSAWSDPNTPDSAKVSLISQLERMDAAYPSGGLVGYIENAKDLLNKSRMGVNPLEGWKPEVPQGENILIGTKEFEAFEKMGMEEMGKCGFVLVAGGLGERLGYGGIKVRSFTVTVCVCRLSNADCQLLIVNCHADSRFKIDTKSVDILDMYSLFCNRQQLGLPTELATETNYLQYYIETILAIQSRYSKHGMKLPLCIMVSNDTNAGTIELLESNDYFGMEKEQITIVQQGDGVPALQDNNATIAMDSKDPCKIQAKPHGHGDIHALLHSKRVALDWCRKGLEWVIFFQDTNGLAFHTLAPALGVSVSRDLVMNSIAVPRKGKQAVGGIAKLTNAEGLERYVVQIGD